MQSYHRVHVQLRKKDRQQVAEMLRKGQESARLLRRASILRQLDGRQRVAQVAANVDVARKTVRGIARRAFLNLYRAYVFACLNSHSEASKLWDDL